MGLVRLLSGGGLVLALILIIVSFWTPAWHEIKNEKSCGLFWCVYGTEMEKLAEKTAMAFDILGIICLLASVVLVFWASNNEEKERLGKIGGALAIAAAFLIMIGMATYTGIYTKRFKAIHDNAVKAALDSVSRKSPPDPYNIIESVLGKSPTVQGNAVKAALDSVSRKSPPDPYNIIESVLGKSPTVQGNAFDWSWGYSYAMGWTAFCVTLIAGVVALVGK